MSEQHTGEVGHPNCPKCRRKVYEHRGHHVDTDMVPSSDQSKTAEPERTRWEQFCCSNCGTWFAVPRDELNGEALPHV
jgi:hypothetical protein